MIQTITWEEILSVWQNKLWPNRSDPIEPTSAMCFLTGYDMDNVLTTPTFFGYIVDDTIVGVNSGHANPNYNNYRSRGLWVDPLYRGQGIGQQLLKATIEQGRTEGYDLVWSFPKLTSWNTYKAVGFNLDSDWNESDNSTNAYCSMSLTNNL